MSKQQDTHSDEFIQDSDKLRQAAEEEWLEERQAALAAWVEAEKARQAAAWRDTAQATRSGRRAP